KGREDNYVTEFQWFSMLADSFGDAELLNKSFDPNKKVKGKDAVVSAMDELDAEWLVSFIGKEDFCDEDCIALAVKNYIIAPNSLAKYLTVEEAKEIIHGTMRVYFDPKNYPQYFEMKTTVPYCDVDDWNVQEIDEENRIITAYIEKIPEIGDVVIYHNEQGLAIPNYINTIEPKGPGLYDICFQPVENPEEFVEDASFSGVADFGFLTGAKCISQTGDSVNKREQSVKSPFAKVAYAAEINKSTMVTLGDASIDTDSCDIEINLSYTNKKTNTDGEKAKKKKAESYVKISTGDYSQKYKFSVDDKGKVEWKQTTEWKKAKVVVGNKDSFIPDDSMKHFKDEVKTGFSANVKIKGLSVFASGEYHKFMNKDRNYAQVFASADKIEVTTSVKLTGEEKIQIARIPFSVVTAETYGILDMYLNVYLIFSASGEATLWWEMDSPVIGIGAYGAEYEQEGVRYWHDYNTEDAGIGGEISASAGTIAELDLRLFGFGGFLDIIDWSGIKLADPGVDIRAYISAKALRPGEDYEYKPEYNRIRPCLELRAQCPVVVFKASTGAGGDSVLGELLEWFEEEGTWEFIKKDSIDVPYKAVYHLEYDADGTIRVLEVNENEYFQNDSAHDRVCTHIVRKEPLDELEENPDATDEEEGADPIHFGGIVLEPEDIVLKMYDALHEGDYETAASCLEPEWEMGINILGNLASALVELITGEDYSWGQILLETAGATDVEVIDIYADNYVMESSVSFLNEWIPNIPGINKLVCTEADVHIKYRYRYNGHCKIETDECHVRRYGFLGWRIDVD
ncbi:MAG: hypothetical protein IJM91_05330, partial [Lachnospiraceae bacterium]|nr:hypothetical protein [Lachnospiraceae bacterium]